MMLRSGQRKKHGKGKAMEERYRLVDGSYTGGKVYAYTKAYILDAEGNILWISLFGSSTALKTLAAQLFSGQGADVRKADGWQLLDRIRKGENPLKTLTQVTADVAHKILFRPDAFMPWKLESSEKRILVFGETLDKAKSRLFKIVDRMVPTPLSPRWSGWLWENVKEHDIRLFLPDPGPFDVCRYVELPADLEERLLDDLKSGALSLH